PGYSVEEVDVYLQWNTAQQYLSYFAEILVGPGNGETVTKYATFTATDPRTAATDFYKLPMRRVIEESPDGVTTLDDVTASTLEVDGAASVGVLVVDGPARVDSLNGAVPGGGGLELLAQQALGDGWADTLANSVRLSGIEALGTTYSKSFTNPHLAWLDTDDLLAVGYSSYNILRWNGSGYTSIASGSLGINEYGVDARNGYFFASSAASIKSYSWNGSALTAIDTLTIASDGTRKIAISHYESIGVRPLSDSAMLVVTKASANTLEMYASYLGVLSYIGATSIGSLDAKNDLCRISDNLMALYDYNGGNPTLKAYRWTGSAFAQTGNTLSLPGITTAKISAYSSSLIGLFNPETQQALTISWSGAVFTIEDTSAAGGTSNYIDVAARTNMEIAYATTDGYVRMYKRTVGGVPYVSRGRTNWGPIYSLSFDAGTTQGEIYTAITDYLGTTSGDEVGTFGRYSNQAVNAIRLGSNIVSFLGEGYAAALTCTKDSTSNIPYRLVVGFAI
ncbi:MAG: hypothetical protein JXM71_00505, partial [Spirochaetales bacterium]|nr:hypothetical protein [Spirochaetales bacterium]